MLGLGNIAVSASMDQLCGRGKSHGIQNGNFANVTSVGVSSGFSPASLLFPLSDCGFSSFPLPSSSSIVSSSSYSSSAMGFSSVAPSLATSSLPVFSLPSVVPSILAVSAPASPSSLPLAPSQGFPPSLPFPSGTPPFPYPSSAFPLSSAPCSALSSFSTPTVSSSFPQVFPSYSSSGSSSSFPLLGILLRLGAGVRSFHGVSDCGVLVYPGGGVRFSFLPFCSFSSSFF